VRNIPFLQSLLLLSGLALLAAPTLTGCSSATDATSVDDEEADDDVSALLEQESDRSVLGALVGHVWVNRQPSGSEWLDLHLHSGDDHFTIHWFGRDRSHPYDLIHRFPQYADHGSYSYRVYKGDHGRKYVSLFEKGERFATFRATVDREVLTLRPVAMPKGWAIGAVPALMSRRAVTDDCQSEKWDATSCSTARGCANRCGNPDLWVCSGSMASNDAHLPGVAAACNGKVECTPPDHVVRSGAIWKCR